MEKIMFIKREHCFSRLSDLFPNARENDILGSLVLKKCYLGLFPMFPPKILLAKIIFKQLKKLVVRKK